MQASVRLRPHSFTVVNMMSDADYSIPRLGVTLRWGQNERWVTS